MSAHVTTASVDYLQRCGAVDTAVDGPRTSGAPDLRRCVHVRGVGRVDDAAPVAPHPGEPWRARTTPLLTGLHGRTPFAFQLAGSPGGVRVELGAWSSAPTGAEVLDRRRDILLAVLGGSYASIQTGDGARPGGRSPLGDLPLRDLPLGGLALGIPDPLPVHEAGGAAGIDRVIAAMAGTTWSALVLAYPLSEAIVARVRQQVLNELRAAGTDAKAEGAPSPLAEQYVELLGVQLRSLGEALSTGAWRTGVYLLGDEVSYPRLAATWRSVFSGRRSLPEPVRVLDHPAAAELAASWSLPDRPGAEGPGLFRRPFELQSLLTTQQLAGYAHLPELETPGFAVESVARFDSERPVGRDAEDLAIGRILHRGAPTGVDYRVRATALTRHAFVAGVTGSGKTNTVLSMLRAARHAGTPFLVIEPAKAEYRTLLADPELGASLRVFTAGDDTVSPLLLNPFEVPDGIAVSEHLDLIRAAFTVAFGMWTPLPQLLERCLHDVYLDRGWDLRTNANRRLEPGDSATLAFPTLADLVAKVHEVVPTLGYEDRITGDLRAALVTRLESLRRGGKGAMLDVARSLPPEELFEAPTVIELEAMGDDGDKAFVTALLLIRLAEHRRARGHHRELVHLLVIEEAHRLLGQTSQPSAEEADPRGHAVETFSNLLAEVRAYGQGVIVADQVPGRLAPAVLKNTDLKIAHRIVAADDRAALAGSMVMDDAQARALATLEVGEAVVFSSGDDGPVLLRVHPVKDRLATAPPPDAEVRTRMAAWREGMDPALFRPRPFCVETCAGAPDACEAARRLTADGVVQRTVAAAVLSTVEDPDALDRMWEDVLSAVRSRRPPAVPEPALLRALAGHAADWYALRRGAQASWRYADTERLGDLLRAALLDRVSPTDAATSARVRRALGTEARRLNRREGDPFPVCGHVCGKDSLCLYRSAAADLVAGRRFHPSWLGADQADAESADLRRVRTWDVCLDAAFDLIEFPGAENPDELNDQLSRTARKVGLCFAQQMLADDDRKLPRTSRRILARVLTQAEL